MAMRDLMLKAINEGGATRESLLELTGTTEKGLASQFTYLRMMGNCPRKKEDGTYEIISAEEWEAHRASGAGKTGKVLTPAERLDKAEKRSKRSATAYDNAKKRFESNADDKLSELKFTKAECELQIAEIELNKAETAYAEAPAEESDVEDATEELEASNEATHAGIEEGNDEVDMFEDSDFDEDDTSDLD